MRKYTSYFYASVLCCIVGAIFASALPTKRPLMFLSESVLDFGIVTPDQRVSKVLRVRNKGNGDLVFSGIQTGCGCTEVSLSTGSVIGPGEEGELTATMTLDKGNAENGKVTEIFVFSNDPINPSVRLIAKASPANKESGFPAVLDFGKLSHAELPVTRLLVRNSFEVVNNKWRASQLEENYIEILPQLSTSKTTSLKVTITTAAPSGEVYCRIKMFEEESGVGEEVLLLANVVGDLVAIPGMVSLGPIYQDDPVAIERIRVDQRGTIPTRLERIENVKLSSSLQNYIKCRQVYGNNEVFVDFEFLDSADAFLSPKTVVGAMTLEASTATGIVQQLNVPIVLAIAKPKL